MTTTERSAMRVALERAARRAHDDGEDEVPPDVLDALIAAAEAQADGGGDTETIEAYRAENARLADDVAARQRSLEDAERTVSQLRYQLRETQEEMATLAQDVDRLSLDNTQMREAVDVAEAAAQVAATPEHRCQYPWTSPDEPTLPCECGRVNPRFAIEEDDEDVEPELTPWDELMLAVRTELADWPGGEDR